MIGVIEPGARAAVAIAQRENIGVIATEATVQSRAYSKAIAKLDRDRRSDRTGLSTCLFLWQKRDGPTVDVARDGRRASI